MSKPHGTKEFWLAGLRADGAALRAAVGQDGALAARVPSCPEWTVEDLVIHVGAIYGWVHDHVGRGVTTSPGRRGDPEVPAGELLPWWDERYAELVCKRGRIELRRRDQVDAAAILAAAHPRHCVTPCRGRCR